jgi:hypothetical protein
MNPIMPSGMIYSRRIASVPTSGGTNGVAIIPYLQTNNKIIYKTPILKDDSVTGSGTTKLLSATLPIGVKTTWIGNLELMGTYPAQCWVSYPDADDQSPAGGRTSIKAIQQSGTSIGWVEVSASISGQIRARLDSSGSMNISTIGFVDYRTLDF